MKNLLKIYWYQFLLILVVAIIGLVNYRFGTYLTGWDNLQTELAPVLGVKRAVFAVWQEYQSFGLVGGMAHASDLLRAIGVWVLSFILPQSLIRYVVHIGMLAVGALGMFKLLEHDAAVIPSETRNLGVTFSHPDSLPAGRQVRVDSLPQNDKPLAFTGSLFYLLNFATIQLFFLPFEPFSIFFASLPWLIWIFLRTLSEISPRPQGGRYDTKFSLFQSPYFLLFLINLLATPSFYVQTLFVVYMLVLGVIGTWRLFTSPRSSESIPRLRTLFAMFAIIIIANLFWILPQAYFLINGGSQTVANAKINQLATQDVQVQNKARGDISSFATFKSFYYDLNGTDQKLLFEPWSKHLENPVTIVATWGIFAIILLGITRKSAYRAPFLGIWLLCAVALLSNTPIFSQLNELISRNSFIAQMFRAPFTKFAIPWALISSYFFMYGLAVILSRLSGDDPLSFRAVGEKSQPSQLSEISHFVRNDTRLPFYLITMLLIFVSFPVFTGNLFSDHVRVKIPNDYFQTMKYFQAVPKESRIALLPQDSFWGWYHYSWGYSGSGFLWYGIEQPIVSPTFDVWSAHSESYLWEMKQALALGEAPKVTAVLKKYNIHYLLVDESVLASSTHQKAFLTSKIKELLASNELVQLEKSFGTISIYKVIDAAPFVTRIQNLPVIGPDRAITNDDSAYASLGDYRSPLSANKENYDYYYPFLDLFSQKNINPPTWKLTENPNTFSLSTQLPFNTDKYSLFSTTDTSLLQGAIQEQTLTISFQKHSYVTIDTTGAKPVQCLKLTVCITYSLPDIAHDQAYIVKVENEHVSGQRLFFYAQNITTGNTVIEDRLSSDTQYYILPSGNRYDRGYTLGFLNNSHVGLNSENALISLQVYHMPLEQLKALYFAHASSDKNTKTIVYNQAYDRGWKAYLNGQELKNHVKINNWANGWVVPANSNGSVRVFFWPQLLEYVGFAAIAVIGISIITKRL